MKKLILLFLIAFTMVMADFTLAGQTLTPVNEDETTPVTTSSIPTTTRTYTTTGSAKTNWGFQPFTVPSDSVTVPAGGDIQAAINSLTTGGTIQLQEGTYTASDITFKGKSNIVLQGAGIGKTFIKTETGEGVRAFFSHCGSENTGGSCMENIIMRDFSINGQGNHAITFAWGLSNALFENLDIQNVISGIDINNNNWKFKGKQLTFRNIHVKDAEFHAIEVRYTRGIILDNIQTENTGTAFDFSRVVYGEVSNVHGDSQQRPSAYNGAKVQVCNYIYIHDTSIKNALVDALKFIRSDKDTNGLQHIHLENCTFSNSHTGVIQFGDAAPTFKEIVVKNVKLVDNIHDGKLYPNIRVFGCENVHEYDDNVGIVVASKYTIDNRFAHNGTTPEADGVGYTTWGNP